MKNRFTEEQIIAALKRLETGTDIKTVCRELGVHQQTIYVWKRKYGGMEVADAKRLKELLVENQSIGETKHIPNRRNPGSAANEGRPYGAEPPLLTVSLSDSSVRPVSLIS